MEASVARLAFVDNAVDTTTGTVKLRALFANEDRALWPGQFCQRDASSSAARTTPSSCLMSPCRPGRTATTSSWCRTSRRSSSAPSASIAARTAKTVIAQGLSGGETVVVDGQSRLINGSLVTMTRARCNEHLDSIHQPARHDGPGHDRHPRIRRTSHSACCRSPTCRTWISRRSRCRRSLPGASPTTMAAAVGDAAREAVLDDPGARLDDLAELAGLDTITLQFSLDRNIDAAAQDVQAAISGALRQLPPTMTTPPTFRKVNPADSPDLLRRDDVDDAAALQGRRVRREHARAAPVDGRGRGAGQRVRLAEICGAHRARPAGAREPPARHRRGRVRRSRSGSVEQPVGTLYGPDRVFNLQVERPARRRRRRSARSIVSLSQRRAGAPRRHRRRLPTACRTTRTRPGSASSAASCWRSRSSRARTRSPVVERIRALLPAVPSARCRPA